MSDASGPNNIGGLVGGNYGTIMQSYATGTVNGGGNVGGLVGWSGGIYGNANNWPGGALVTQSYATGNVKATATGGAGSVGWSVRIEGL